MSGLSENSPQSRDVVMLELQKKLSALGEQSAHRRPTSDIHTNDAYLAASIQTLKHRRPKKSNKLSVAMFVGGGGVFSIAPRLDVDLVILADKNTFIHDFYAYALRAYLSLPTLEDYFAAVYTSQNPLEKELALIPAGPDLEMTSLDKYHFLYNNKIYKQNQARMQNLPLSFAAIDLANSVQIEKMTQALSDADAEITFAKLTNVREHSPAVVSTLPLLPFSSKAAILYSTQVNHNIPSQIDIRGLAPLPITSSATGLNAYLKQSGYLYSQYQKLMDPTRRYNSGGG